MNRRIFSSVVTICFLTGALWAANDPFCGEWKLDAEKSTLHEVMRIEDLGANTYKIISGNVSDTIIADGTDQPSRFGQTTSITSEGPRVWKMVNKKDSAVIGSMIHTLSPDGKTQIIEGNEFKPDGSTPGFRIQLKRVGTGSSWAGTWVITDAIARSSFGAETWIIERYQGNGLTFNSPADESTLSMKFDGRDYKATGPTMAPGATSAGKRVNSHRLVMTGKDKGEVMARTTFTVSLDGKTLTVQVWQTGQPQPLEMVYDKI